MADLSITAANVAADSSAVVDKEQTAGATITAGQTVYKDSADKKMKLADADASAATATVVGIALHGADDGQPLSILTKGKITIGATVTAGTFYYLSPNPGGIAPVADILSGDYVSQIGYADTTSTIIVDFKNTGVQL